MSHEPPSRPRNGAGAAALVFGIIAAVFVFVPVVGPFVAAPAAPLALGCGLVGFLRAENGAATNKGMALAGGVLGLGSSLGIIVIVAAAIGPAGPPAAVVLTRSLLERSSPGTRTSMALVAKDVSGWEP